MDLLPFGSTIGALMTALVIMCMSSIFMTFIYLSKMFSPLMIFALRLYTPFFHQQWQITSILLISVLTLPMKRRQVGLTIKMAATLQKAVMLGFSPSRIQQLNPTLTILGLGYEDCKFRKNTNFSSGQLVKMPLCFIFVSSQEYGALSHLYSLQRS